MASLRLSPLKTLILGFVLSLGLQAQVGTSLAPVTDLLDVYKSGGVKPEMLTMIDMSGSMTAVFWHRKFWTNKSYGTHIGGTPGDDGIQFTVSTTLDNLTNNTLTMAMNGKGPNSTNKWTTDLTGFLVDASGNRISGVLTMALVKTATHARMTGSRKINGTTYTRTVDMPFPWSLLKSPLVAPLTTAPLSTWIDGVADPDVTGNNYIAYDTVYTTASQVTNPTGSNGLDSWFSFNTDYVDWMFFGQDTKGSSGSDNYGATGTFKDDNGTAPAASGTVGTTAATGGFVIGGATVNAGNRPGFLNGLPVGTRCQYVKRAVLTAWFANRDRVWWAYRFLDQSSNEEGLTTINSSNFTTRGTRSKERDLILLQKSTSGSTHASVTAIQAKTPTSVTPLTYALANCLAQLTVDDGHPSVFDLAGTGEIPPPCRTSYVILFTDGNANDSLTAGSTSGNAIGAGGGTWTSEAQIQTGGTAVSYANLTPGSSNFNLWSLAAVAAHGLPNASQVYWGASAPSAYAPFIIKSRGSAGTSGRRITIMTVGLCLSGTNSDTGGGKGPLLKAALFGDPKTAGFDVTTAVPYGTTGGAQTNFFDATDPVYLANSLNAIMRRVVSANTGITAPSAPLVGLNLGNRAYLGRFEANNDGQGSIWKGDLLMTGIGLQSDGTVGLKAADGTFQSDINASNAVASAAVMLYAKTWKNRKIYTVIPGTAIPAGGLPLTAAAQAFSDTNAALRDPVVMGTADATSAVALIRFIMGANSTDQAKVAIPTTGTVNTRTDIMGDVVNSSPAAIEFDPALIPAYSNLSTLWGSTYSTMKDARFQLIFAGDNQGHFHCFGEVSGFDTAGRLFATLDELWSFVPSEFLNKPGGANVNKLGQLMTGDPSTHLYAVDGTPIIYFNDAPVSGSTIGNFKVDSADTVRVIFGLRKGGRSYYAIDIKNPAAPVLSWMVDPNNGIVLGSGTPSSYTDPAIKTMGLATSTIGLAAVDPGPNATTPRYIAILGGGYSNNELDGLTVPPNAGAAKLGRSLLALDVETGAPVKIYDFVNNAALASSFPNMGAIAAGGFPFQFLLGSGRAQRVYFGDQSGGVYALGSMEKLTSGAPNWRLDHSNIDQWTTDGTANSSITPGNAGVRWIYKGQTTLSAGLVTAASPVTSIPVAFRVPRAIPQFLRPAGSTYAANMIPPAVGVTFGTGDRNDPMDKDPINPVSSRVNRQVMVFDRQDSADLPTVGGLPSNVDISPVTDSQLADLTSVTTPGDTSYLGNNQLLGYYLRFHAPIVDPNDATHYLYEKAYLTPLVINGALVFSTFRPASTGSSTTCQGAGTTYTYRMGNALSPAFANGDVSTAAAGGGDGYVFTWANLAGDLTSVGSRLVLQSGQDATSATSNSVKIQSFAAGGGTIAFAPRTWRIVR
ncbi:MAG: hypothetical protein HXX12_04050 [Geothrix sp.]|uniref:PilC/PilY family type IV pilus protein n=1 Tax=Geothrix sp. TaxID=1962974 RepID=UPI0018321A10|nr:PilC/PilY family type IV pilus protein [Geothrix sp.]NWJ40126.1 hypothetical protein [Geothrix sp.]WIL21865.1 MAG: PilC/PilY family type IV pilus protein [Geothrix sp.]